MEENKKATITMNDVEQMTEGMELGDTVEAITAKVVDIKATDKKQVSWNKLGDLAIADFPSGKQIHFDLTALSTQVLKYYGAKQWLADQVASVKDETEKIAEMQASYNEAAKAGLQLSSTGKVQIIGKVRSNATSGDKVLAASMKTASQVVSLEGLVVKKQMAALPGFPEFTKEDQIKLDELLVAAAEAVGK